MANEKKSFYKYLIPLLVVGVMAGIFIGVTRYDFFNCLFSSGNLKCENKTVAVFIKITTGSNGGDFLEYHVPDQSTALDFLKMAANVETKGEGVNAFVTQINGYPDLRRANLPREFWAFYINGKMSKVGAGSYKLKDGDKIEWKVEKY